MIKLKKVSKIFNEGTINENIAINDVNLNIKEGDFITIIGSNGAGKTTLFNLIAGTMFPTYGSLFIKQLHQLEMNLESRMKNNVILLSGGQRQALTLLIMVLSKPALILLDE